MKTLRTLLFYGFLIIGVVTIGQLPVLLHIFHAAKGAYYPYLDTIAFSDFYYPAIVRFGMGPDWLVKIPYVTEPHTGSIIQIFFLLLGKMALVLHLDPSEIIALFRIIGGVLFLISSVFLIKVLVPESKRRRVFILFLMAQPMPFMLHIVNEWYGKWTWHFGEAARRVSIMPPHYTVGKGLAILSLFFFFYFLKTHKKILLFVSGVIIVISGIIYPPPVFIIVFSLVISAGVYIFKLLVTRKQMPIKKIFSFVTYIVFCLLPLVLLRMELAKGYPWNMWSTTELGWNDPKMHFEWEYVHMLGGLVIFLPFAFFRCVKEKKHSYFDFFLWVWCLSAFLLFPFANMLRLGKFRFTEGVQLLPLSILALYGIEAVGRMGKYIQRIIISIVVVSFMVFTSLTVYSDTLSLWGNWSNVYFVKEEISALKFLDSYVTSGDIVLADNYSSNYIPAFARVRTILGFSDFYENYSDFQTQEWKVNSFLKGDLPQNDARDLLLKNNVKIVYYKSFAMEQRMAYPTLLENIYLNNFYQIYKVKEIIK